MAQNSKGRVRVRTEIALIVATLVMTTALADDGKTIAACVTGESSEIPAAESKQASESGQLDIVRSTQLATLAPDRLLVDVRPQARSLPQAVPGALRMDLLDLQILVGRDQREVLVFGLGDDDGQLARRLARWPESDRIRLVAGGAPAIAMQARQKPSARLLSGMLATAPVRALAASINDDLQVVALDDFESRFFPLHHRLPKDIELDQPQAVQAVALWLSEQDVEPQKGVLLVDSSGRHSAALAPDLSLALGRPVFFVDGGGRSIEAYARQFANMNRQPRSFDRGCKG